MLQAQWLDTMVQRMQKERDKVVVVDGSGAKVVVKTPVTGDVNDPNTTEALFKKRLMEKRILSKTVWLFLVMKQLYTDL